MQKPCTIKSKAESSKLLLKSWALCYPWKASKYSGIRALHLWHMLHPSKQTRTVFVPLFKLKKKKHNTTCLTGCDYISKSSLILYQSCLTQALKSLCAAAMRFDLSILCPRASTDNICFACTVLGNAGAPIPAQEQLCYHAETVCAPPWPGETDKNTQSVHVCHCNNIWPDYSFPTVRKLSVTVLH